MLKSFLLYLVLISSTTTNCSQTTNTKSEELDNSNDNIQSNNISSSEKEVNTLFKDTSKFAILQNHSEIESVFPGKYKSATLNNLSM